MIHELIVWLGRLGVITLFVLAAGLPLGHWSHQPWRRSA